MFIWDHLQDFFPSAIWNEDLAWFASKSPSPQEWFEFQALPGYLAAKFLGGRLGVGSPSRSSAAWARMAGWRSPWRTGASARRSSASVSVSGWAPSRTASTSPAPSVGWKRPPDHSPVPRRLRIVRLCGGACRGRSGWGRSARPPFGPYTQRVLAGPAPVDGGLIAKPLQEPLVQLLPDASVLPVAQSPPAGPAAAAAHLFWQQAPRVAGAEDEHDAAEGGAVGDARAAALRLRRLLR
jgi:hypothetical protein